MNVSGRPDDPGMTPNTHDWIAVSWDYGRAFEWECQTCKSILFEDGYVMSAPW